MIAIAAISEKLATIAARLTAACPVASRSCSSASARSGLRGSRRGLNNVRESCGMDKYQVSKPVVLEAKGAEQCVLAAALCGIERVGGEDQEAACEERQHLEFVEVHAVGARRIGARLIEVLDRGGVCAGWERSL